MSIVARKRGGKTYLYFQAGREDYIYLGPESDRQRLKSGNILKAIGYLDEKLEHYEDLRSQLVLFLPEEYRSTLARATKIKRRPGGRTPKVAIKPHDHLSEIEKKLHIEHLHDRIQEILRKVSRHPFLREKPQLAVVAASILVAIREKGYAVLKDEVAGEFPSIEYEDMDYCYRIIADKMDLPFRMQNVSNFVTGIGKKASMGDKAVDRAIALITEASGYGYTSRKNFLLAAAALYIAGCEAEKGKYDSNKLYDIAERLSEAANEGVKVIMNSAEYMAEFIKKNRSAKKPRTKEMVSRKADMTRTTPSIEKTMQ